MPCYELDREDPVTKGENQTKGRTKKSRFRTTLTFAALFIVGGLAGFGVDPILAFLGIDFGEANLNPWVLIPSLLLSALFVLAFHEAGHVIVGKLVGFRFSLFIVGPFKLHSTESGIRFGLNRSLMLAGGLGGAAPRDSQNLTRRMAVYVAGGPAASGPRVAMVQEHTLTIRSAGSGCRNLLQSRVTGQYSRNHAMTLTVFECIPMTASSR